MVPPCLGIGTGLAPLLAGCRKTISVQQNFDSRHVWDKRRTPPQDAQKVRPARAQRVKGEAYPLGYVEGLTDARTLLAGFFSILLAFGCPNRRSYE